MQLAPAACLPHTAVHPHARVRRQVLGNGVAPHLGTVAAALPAVWSRVAPGQVAPGAPGTETRLHSALIAVLTHLLRRLPDAAMARPCQRLCAAGPSVTARDPVLCCACTARSPPCSCCFSAVTLRCRDVQRGTLVGRHAQAMEACWESLASILLRVCASQHSVASAFCGDVIALAQHCTRHTPWW